MISPEIIIHIGITKTGTTSIQNALAVNKRKLEKEGILYPSSFLFGAQHLGLSMSCLSLEKEFNPRQIHNIQTEAQIREYLDFEKEKLIQEFSTLNPNKIIFSDEGLSGISLSSEAESLAKTIEALNPATTKIVCYLRSQESHISSNMAQSITSGQHYPELNFPVEHIDDGFYNYKKKLDIFSDVFGKENLILKIYEDHSNFGGTVADLIEEAKLPITTPSGAENISHSKRTILLLNEINKYDPFALLTPAQKFTATRTLSRIIDESFACPEKYQISEATKQEVKTRLKESNEDLMTVYFPGRLELFPSETKPSQAGYEKISPEQIPHLMKYIIQAARSAIEEK